MTILVSAKLNETNVYSIVHGSLAIDKLYGLCHEASSLDPPQTERGTIGSKGMNFK
jgi:hypothetical protein